MASCQWSVASGQRVVGTRRMQYATGTYWPLATGRCFGASPHVELRIESQLRHALCDVSELREETVAQTHDAVDAEAERPLDAVAQERVLVMDAVRAERIATIEDAVPLIQDAIDHAVWRAAQLLAAVGVFAVLLAGVVVLGLRRGSRSTGS